LYIAEGYLTRVGHDALKGGPGDQEGTSYGLWGTLTHVLAIFANKTYS